MTLREFESEFKRLYMPLGMYALRIVGDTGDAEDIVQESFAKAWQQNLSGDIDNFKAYMYRSVRNSCIDFIRRKHDRASVDEITEVFYMMNDNELI